MEGVIRDTEGPVRKKGVCMCVWCVCVGSVYPGVCCGVCGRCLCVVCLHVFDVCYVWYVLCVFTWCVCV